MLPIHVISLVRAEQRRQRVVSQLGRLQLDFSFIDAVDKDRLSDEQIAACDSRQFLLNTGRESSLGEIACFASHRKAWQLCVDSGKPIVVMEDDFAVLEGFRDALEVAEKFADTLGFIRLQTETRANKRKIAADGEHTLWRYTKVPHSMAAYVISPQAASKLLAGSEEMTGPSDIYIKMFWLHSQVIYGLTPYVITESDLATDSHIGKRRKAKKSLTTQMRRSLQRASHWWHRIIANIRLPDALNPRQ